MVRPSSARTTTGCAGNRPDLLRARTAFLTGLFQHHGLRPRLVRRRVPLPPTPAVCALNRQMPPGVPVRVRRTGRGTVASLPRHEHKARPPLVPVRATFRVEPPSRPPHAHETIRTRVPRRGAVTPASGPGAQTSRGLAAVAGPQPCWPAHAPASPHNAPAGPGLVPRGQYRGRSRRRRSGHSQHRTLPRPASCWRKPRLLSPRPRPACGAPHLAAVSPRGAPVPRTPRNDHPR